MLSILPVMAMVLTVLPGCIDGSRMIVRTRQDSVEAAKTLFGPGPYGQTMRGRPTFQGMEGLRMYLGLSSNYQFAIRYSREPTPHITKVRIEQYFKGIPVYGSSIVAEQDVKVDGRFYYDSVQGSYLSDYEVERTTPLISVETAIVRMKAYYGHYELPVNAPSATVFVYPFAPNSTAALVYRIQYFIGPEHVTLVQTGRLAELPVMPIGFVDANTGQVYACWNGLSTAFSLSSISLLTGNNKAGQLIRTANLFKDIGTGQCLYNATIRTNPKDYLLVYNYKPTGSMLATFNCSDGAKPSYDLTNGAFSPRNAAFVWGQETVSLFRNTIDDTPTNGSLCIVVHYPGMGAAWNGSCITISDGDALTYHPFSEPDIIAHEMAHAFTDSQSRLEYREQSGAINEAYSDMAGIALLDKVFGRKTYEIGRTVTKGTRPLRNMCNPTLIPPAIDHVSQWRSNISLHAGSGIFNKAFCIISRKSGWSIQSAFKVFTLANSLYWRAATNFASAVCGVQEAALDLGINVQDIKDAFAVVGVTCV